MEGFCCGEGVCVCVFFLSGENGTLCPFGGLLYPCFIILRATRGQLSINDCALVVCKCHIGPEKNR